jgi:hypothetical protein
VDPEAEGGNYIFANVAYAMSLDDNTYIDVRFF